MVRPGRVSPLQIRTAPILHYFTIFEITGTGLCSILMRTLNRSRILFTLDILSCTHCCMLHLVKFIFVIADELNLAPVTHRLDEGPFFQHWLWPMASDFCLNRFLHPVLVWLLLCCNFWWPWWYFHYKTSPLAWTRSGCTLLGYICPVHQPHIFVISPAQPTLAVYIVLVCTIPFHGNLWEFIILPNKSTISINIVAGMGIASSPLPCSTSHAARSPTSSSPDMLLFWRFRFPSSGISWTMMYSF